MFRFQTQIQNAVGHALDGVQLYVCDQPATTDTIPPSPLITLYTDATGATELANPAVSDGNGNLFFYAPAGIYTLVFYDTLQRIPEIILPDMQVTSTGAGGPGTVTSVALTMPAEFSVAGSPVISAGTLAVTKATQNALTVYAGPTSGPAAAPTFKDLATLLAAAGIGDGTVTSVAIAQTLSSLLTGSVSGSPITTNGTITLTINFANQSANTFLAGPASGGVGPVTARSMVTKDLPAMSTVTFSSTPTFDASAALGFTIVLTGNVITSLFSNPSPGYYTFIVKQDATGGRTFTWPTNFIGASVVDTTPSFVTTQTFYYDGTNARAISGAIVTPT